MPKSGARKEWWAGDLSAQQYTLAKKNGMYRRDGSKLWWVRLDGKRTSAKTEVLEDAVAWVNQRKDQTWKEKEMGVRRKYSWRDACLKREQEDSKGMASWGNEEQRLRWWWPHLKDVTDLNKITRQMIIDIIESGKLVNPEPTQKYGDGVVRVDKSGPASCNTTANKYIRAVATILNKAEREWGWGNTAPTLKTYEDGLPRDAAPTPYHMVKFVEEMVPHTRDMMVYGLMTAHRRGNVTGLKWTMIDWDRRAVAIEGMRTKTGKQIYVPLNSVSLEILQRRYDSVDKHGKPNRHPVYVFTWRGNRVKQVVTKAFRRGRTTAGMEDVCFHTTRHCWQSWLAEDGISPEMRARLGGWKVKGMGAMDDYVHLNIEPLRQSIEIVAQKWQAGVAMRTAEKSSGIAVEMRRAGVVLEKQPEVEITVSSQSSGKRRHSPWVTA